MRLRYFRENAGLRCLRVLGVLSGFKAQVAYNRYHHIAIARLGHGSGQGLTHQTLRVFAAAVSKQPRY